MKKFLGYDVGMSILNKTNISTLISYTSFGLVFSICHGCRDPHYLAMSETAAFYCLINGTVLKPSF